MLCGLLLGTAPAGAFAVRVKIQCAHIATHVEMLLMRIARNADQRVRRHGQSARLQELLQARLRILQRLGRRGKDESWFD
jgi:hypothetical protein